MPVTDKNFPIAELDFDRNKDNLKEFLKSQDRFKDYDFEGSNLNVLLDILAYNTYKNNYYNNMAISEMFLDSAQLRDSVVSHAKELNYLPRSRNSARAVVDVSLNVNDNPPFITIPEKTKFKAKCGNTTYNFYNENSATIFPVNGVYTYRNLDIYEGRYISERFVAEPSEKRYIISNENIDLNSLRVYVSKNDEENEYLYAADLFEVTEESRVFFVQPHIGNSYELFFGRNVFGVEPPNGSVINVEYRVTAGEEANGVTSFAPAEDVQGYQTNTSLRSPSKGGSEREDIESIRYYAPKSIQIQERAITTKDYEILLKRRFPEIRSIAVYGGEELSPPQYGRVIATVDIGTEGGLSRINRDRYRTYLKDRCSLAVEPVITPAQFMYYDVDTTVYYNTKTTNKSSGDIRSIVHAAILDFSKTNLDDFRRNMRKSRLTSFIDNSDENIISNQTYLRAVVEISPSPNFEESYSLKFNNTIIAHPPRRDPTLSEGGSRYPVGVISSNFVFNGVSSFIRDNGKGKLQVITRDQDSVEVLAKDVGDVKYDTGEVDIRRLRVEDYAGSRIKIFATPVENDIRAPRERVTSIRPQDIRLRVVGRRE